MSKKGIEDMLNELEMFVDSCKFQPLSSSKIVVPKEELMEIIRELRLKMPGELERCQKIMRNKEGIIIDAREQAEQILSNASAEASTLVAEHEVVQLAQIRAQEIMIQAEREANDIIMDAKYEADKMIQAANDDSNAIRVGAMEYTKDKLDQIGKIMHDTLIEGSQRYNAMLDLIEAGITEVNKNRQEIEGSLGGDTQPEATLEETEPEQVLYLGEEEIKPDSYEYKMVTEDEEFDE